jgi:hypothetical protein
MNLPVNTPGMTAKIGSQTGPNNTPNNNEQWPALTKIASHKTLPFYIIHLFGFRKNRRRNENPLLQKYVPLVE